MTTIQKLRWQLMDARLQRDAAVRLRKSEQEATNAIYRAMDKLFRAAAKDVFLGEAGWEIRLQHRFEMVHVLARRLPGRRRSCALYVIGTPSGRPRIPRGAKTIHIQAKREATTKEKAR
jgi:hypothetical protein